MLIIFTSGIIDAWKLIRESDYLVVAARHGARTAAALSSVLEATGNREEACDNAAGTSEALGIGVLLAYQYLTVLNLETKPACVPSVGTKRSCSGNNFTVNAEFVTLSEGGFDQRAIRVSAAANNTDRCIVCAFTALQSSQIAATATYPVEAECALTGVLTP